MKNLFEQITRINYQQSKFRRIIREMFFEDANKTHKHQASLKCWLILIVGLGLLHGCTVTDQTYSRELESSATEVALANPTENLTLENLHSTPNQVFEITPTETLTPIIEPSLDSLPLSQSSEVKPPRFNEKDTTLSLAPFDLVDAHAVYALYRQQQGPAMWSSDADFTADMASYAEELKKKGMELKQATVEDQTFSLLTRDNDILLNFDADGDLKDSDPGRWSTDSTPEWIDAGGPVELFIGEDGHAYIGKQDADGKVIAFLNTIGATRDNMNQQWIEVRNGYPTKWWNGEIFTDSPPIRMIVGHALPNPEQGEYTFMTFEEISSFPTTLTPEDRANSNLGLLFRFQAEDIPDINVDIQDAWIAGKIVASRNGSYMTVDGVPFKFTETVIDTFDSSGGIVRIYGKLNDFHFISLFNLKTLQEATDYMRQKGHNTQETMIENLGIITQAGFEGKFMIPTRNREKTFDEFSQNDLVGLEIGVLVMNIGGVVRPGVNMFERQVENPLIRILLEPESEFDQNTVRTIFLGFGNIALHAEQLKK